MSLIDELYLTLHLPGNGIRYLKHELHLKTLLNLVRPTSFPNAAMLQLQPHE